MTQFSDIEIRTDSRPGLGRVWRLEAAQFVGRPIDEVFPFFADAHNLERITPSLLRFEVLTPKPIEMRAGLVLEYRLRVRGVPIRWTTAIEDWDPPHGFVDRQLRGPYALWHHTHTFEAVDGGTVCRDAVVYRPRGGLAARVINAVFVRRDVESIFRYRARALGEVFGDA